MECERMDWTVVESGMEQLQVAVAGLGEGGHVAGHAGMRACGQARAPGFWAAGHSLRCASAGGSRRRCHSSTRARDRHTKTPRADGWPPKLGKPKSTYRNAGCTAVSLVQLRGSPLRVASTVKVGLSWVACTVNEVSLNYLHSIIDATAAYSEKRYVSYHLSSIVCAQASQSRRETALSMTYGSKSYMCTD